MPSIPSAGSRSWWLSASMRPNSYPGSRVAMGPEGRVPSCAVARKGSSKGTLWAFSNPHSSVLRTQCSVEWWCTVPLSSNEEEEEPRYIVTSNDDNISDPWSMIVRETYGGPTPTYWVGEGVGQYIVCHPRSAQTPPRRGGAIFQSFPQSQLSVGILSSRWIFATASKATSSPRWPLQSVSHHT